MITATTLANAARALNHADEIGDIPAYYARGTDLARLCLAYEREQQAMYADATRVWSDRRRQFTDAETERLRTAVRDEVGEIELECGR